MLPNLLIEPKQVELDGKQFIISKYPAIQGREIVSKYPVSNLPKLGDYKISEETMLKLMKYVGVLTAGSPEPLMLSTEALINSHVGSWETLVKLEKLSLEYNCTFFQNERASTFFAGIAQKLPAIVTKILTECLGQLSNTGKPRSES